jgi:serine/threonine protein phosphatase PrpC
MQPSSSILDHAGKVDGFKRDQDRYVTCAKSVPGFFVMGIFDGHGGEEAGGVAEEAAHYLPQFCRSALEELPTRFAYLQRKKLIGVGLSASKWEAEQEDEEESRKRVLRDMVHLASGEKADGQANDQHTGGGSNEATISVELDRAIYLALKAQQRQHRAPLEDDENGTLATMRAAYNTPHGPRLAGEDDSNGGEESEASALVPGAAMKDGDSAVDEEGTVAHQGGPSAVEGSATAYAMALFAFEQYQQRRQRLYERDYLKPVLNIKRQMEEETGVDMPTTMPAEGGTTATLVLIEPGSGGGSSSFSGVTTISTSSGAIASPASTGVGTKVEHNLGTIHAAWVGDSRAVLGTLTTDTLTTKGCSSAGDGMPSTSRGSSNRNGDDRGTADAVEVRAVPLTVDHNVESSEEEVARAVSRGGAVCGKYIAVEHMDGMLQVPQSRLDCSAIVKFTQSRFSLQVLRSLGDCGMHQNDIVTAVPELTSHDIEPQDAFLIVASDGLWGAFTDDEAVRFVYRELVERGYMARQKRWRLRQEEEGGALVDDNGEKSSASASERDHGKGQEDEDGEDEPEDHVALGEVCACLVGEARRRMAPRLQTTTGRKGRGGLAALMAGDDRERGDDGPAHKDDISAVLLTFAPFWCNRDAADGGDTGAGAFQCNSPGGTARRMQVVEGHFVGGS